MSKPFIKKLFLAHQDTRLEIPDKEIVASFIAKFFSFLFPVSPTASEHDLEQAWDYLQVNLRALLAFFRHGDFIPDDVVHDFFMEIPSVYETLLTDIDAVVNFDPASSCKEEVIATYPGFFAIGVYRIANILYKHQVPILPRMMTELAHSKTGIDINPGATIGKGFFIDHGTGIVIGETTAIGNNVKIYQGVTLGAMNVQKALANKKRHPTIEDEVIIYANATILGGNTVIGHHSVIGGNTFITKSVAPYSTILPVSGKGRNITH